MAPQTGTAVQPVKTSAIARPSEFQQTIDRMQQLYDSIAKRAFEIFEQNGRPFGRELSDWFQAESEILHPVHLEIAESDDALTVKAEVPGFSAQELDVRVEGSRLTISGTHESKEETTKGRTIYSELCANEVFRSIDLPSAVDGSKVSATLKDGVLQIELPKTDRAKSVPVESKMGS